MRFSAGLVFALLALMSNESFIRADNATSLTPAQEFQSLVKAQRDARDRFDKEYVAAIGDQERQSLQSDLGAQSTPEYYAGKFLFLMQKYPKDQAALDAFLWMVSKSASAPQTSQAAALVISNWIDDDKLADVCQALAYYPASGCDAILRAAIEKSPHRAVRGYARYSLGLSLAAQAERLNDDRASAPLMKETEKLLEEIVADYGDLKTVPSSPKSGTLGKAAQAELFELRNLAIGKTAPEIAGEDLDGKSMKLSDLRGKIVLLSFWNSHCGPCLADLEQHRVLLEHNRKKPFAIVGVNADDDRAAAQRACVNNGCKWASFWDAGRSESISGQWNVRAWPTLYLIDAKGVIRYKGNRLRAVNVRKGADGELVQYRLLDDAVAALLTEMSRGQKP